MAEPSPEPKPEPELRSLSRSEAGAPSRSQSLPPPLDQVAWLSAYRFARQPPTFVGLDDVVFKKPVEVGP